MYFHDISKYPNFADFFNCIQIQSKSTLLYEIFPFSSSFSVYFNFLKVVHVFDAMCGVGRLGDVIILDISNFRLFDQWKYISR